MSAASRGAHNRGLEFSSWTKVYSPSKEVKKKGGTGWFNERGLTQKHLKGLTGLAWPLKLMTEVSTIDYQLKYVFFLSYDHFILGPPADLSAECPQIWAWTWAWSSDCVSSSVWTPAGRARKPAWTDLRSQSAPGQSCCCCCCWQSTLGEPQRQKHIRLTETAEAETIGGLGRAPPTFTLPSLWATYRAKSPARAN